ncbi:MAG: EamA family transporter [Pseudomonadota bacterium]|nr:EamA family transporter [Pseudomonadota bacterium]
MSSPPAIRDIALSALAPLIWGSTYWVTVAFLPADRPFTAAVLRCLPAGILLLLFARHLPARGEWGRLTLLAFFNIAWFQGMLFVSAYRLPGGVAAILTATQVLMVLALGWLLGKQAPSRLAWGSALVGIAGVALLMLSPEAAFDGIGIAAALAGAAAVALGLHFSKHWPIRLPVLAFTGWQLLLGGAMLLPMAILTEPLPQQLTWRNIGGYLYLCLFGSVLAYLLFFRGLRRLPSALVASLGLLSPVCAFVLGWLLLGQTLDGKGILGFVLILVAITGVQRATRSSN